MDIFSFIFLASWALGLWMVWLLMERLILVAALKAGNRSHSANPWCKMWVFLWIATSTYNCWYLFVKGL